jgi:hypothetical protein
MNISLNNIFKEAYGASNGLQQRLERLYPVNCNLNFSGIQTASLHLNKEEKILSSSASEAPQFTLHIDLETASNILKEKTIPSEKIDGDAELALMFLMVLAESNIDLEVLIYTRFGTVPGLMMRKLLGWEPFNNQNKANDSRLWSLQRDLRDIAIRIDRLEQTLVV